MSFLISKSEFESLGQDQDRQFVGPFGLKRYKCWLETAILELLKSYEDANEHEELVICDAVVVYSFGVSGSLNSQHLLHQCALDTSWSLRSHILQARVELLLY